MEKLRCSPPEPTNKEIIPELNMLDLCTIGLLVIGIRAYVDPEKYGDSDFIQNAVATAQSFGYLDETGIHAPQTLIQFAFPEGKMQ